MQYHLGILVTSEKHLDNLEALTDAAYALGKRIWIFFTGTGVSAALQPAFQDLSRKAETYICEASFRDLGLHSRENEISGDRFKGFVPQTKYAEMITITDRHIQF